MKNVFILIILFCVAGQVVAQSKGDTLFNTQTPLDIAMTVSIREIAKSKEDTSYISNKLYYYKPAGIKDSIKAGIKARGNYRLKNCYFPPMWIKFEKKNIKNTLFEGNKKLKLVLPCQNVRGNNELVLKEYLCYKLYEVLTPYAFKTRLVNIDLTEERRKDTKSFRLKGILIEDVDNTAKRFDAKEVKDAIVNTVSLDDTTALEFDFFQLMIANTDWSKSFQHNSKIIYQPPKYIPIPYDFDLCGVVDAPYAIVSLVGDEELPIKSVTERYYRGHCQSDGTTEFVRKEYLSKKEKLLSVPDILKGTLPDKEIDYIKKYLGDFFKILENDRMFRDEIVSRCR